MSVRKARYIMVGGFLGAGKSTSLLKLARYLNEKNLKVGLITNDQAAGLVDTTLMHSHGFPVEEIAGGCFCCRFGSLLDAATRLSKETTPDVFLAEPVGSCTDLVASVSYPLRRIYGDNFLVAPLSVLVDPIRAQRIFGLEAGRSFSRKVIYVYRKQLEEADVIVVNKCDLLHADALRHLRARLAQEFPKAEIVACSARHGLGLQPWFEKITETEQCERPTVELDYDQYAAGEAALGWLNATVRVTSTATFDGNRLLKRLARQLQELLHAAEIAHLKMTLSPGDPSGAVAVLSLVRNDYMPELSQSLPDPVEGGELILNIRAEAEPETLRDAVLQTLTSVRRLRLEVEHLEHFRPPRPVPTHRVTVAGGPA